ncbi:hypothetical protein QE152_g10362 [Popillia japonica]|uniref:EB domain-containing protein n=1 Tax=Popillia japonica TaxID=7064 RepID=A0AAW1LVI0_POPJA
MIVAGWQELLLVSLALFGALADAQQETEAAATTFSSQSPSPIVNIVDVVIRGTKKFGDRCNDSAQCGFDGSFCNGGMCMCIEDLPITNHIDKCGKEARINESCFFTEQCEVLTSRTVCRDGFCSCRFEQQAFLKPDGNYECRTIQYVVQTERYTDPAMIGILVAMFLMFIIICIVLRLFSRARWRENRTIFNTPNPRLMNVSLLRDSKLLHQERRGSRSSARGPSRQPSMASLRAHSPNSQGSRRGSKGSSSASATSMRSSRSITGSTQLNSQSAFVIVCSSCSIVWKAKNVYA